MLSWSISPMQMHIFYFLVLKKWGNLKVYLTLSDAFMVKSVSKCSLFTYILEHFQLIEFAREKSGTKIVIKMYIQLYLTSVH